jgi:ectoine hydroxylase-related dioxygenase (phytanoyl-CoA dioxygenase family)
VFLSDCPSGDHGNFTVWPGTHLETARWLRARGTGAADPETFFADLRELADASSEPTPLAVRAGDLLLAHYLLLHSSGRHRGPNIRYAVFYRLTSHQHAEIADVALTDPWLDWPAFQTAP